MPPKSRTCTIEIELVGGPQDGTLLACELPMVRGRELKWAIGQGVIAAYEFDGRVFRFQGWEESK